jgi:hypothetical protein
MWSTEADFQNDFYRSYKEARLGDYVKPGEVLGSIIWAIRSSQEITVPQSTKSGLSVINNLLSDAIFWFASFHMTLEDKERASTLFSSIFALTLKITQDSIVVRDLIVRGYDLQARNLVRSSFVSYR